ncbi:hypothetical protein GF373_04015 [bacterium]|nr:hypothetical protein [bacterium]
MNGLIPPPDPLGIPSLAIIFQALGWLTLTLHIIFMNFVLGGTFIVTLQEWIYGNNPEVAKGNSLLIRIMPVAISLAITMGVAPLLFVQVLYGQFFYSANIMMGGIWLSIIGLVMIAFYALYILIAKRPADQRASWTTKGILLFNLLLFFAIAFLFTNNAVLTENPHYWPDIYSKVKSFVAPDASLLPRYLHNVVGAVGIAGVWMAVVGLYHKTFYPENESMARTMIRSGLIWALITSIVQIVTGGLYLVSLGMDLIKEFMGNGFLFVAWTISVCTAIFAIITLILALLNDNNAKFIWASVGLFFLTLFGMVMGRDLVRILSLNDYFTIQELVVRPSHSSLILFLVTFVLGLVILGYLIRLVWTMPKKEPSDHSY